MPFLAIVFLTLPLIVVTVFMLPSLRKHLDMPRQSPAAFILSFKNNLNLRKAILAQMVIVSGQFVLFPFFTPFVVYNLLVEEQYIKFLYLATGLFSIVASPLIGKLSDKYGKIPVLSILCAISIVMALIITNQEPGITFWALMPIAILYFGFTGTRNIPAMALITDTILPQQRGAFLSLNSALMQVTGGISISLTSYLVYQDKGTLFVHGIPQIGWFVALTSALGIFLARRVVVVKTLG
jgi:predicted MFS family arabinose efflux permease